MWERDGLPSWIPEVKLCNTLIFQDNLSLMKIKHKFKLRGFLSFFFFFFIHRNNQLTTSPISTPKLQWKSVCRILPLNFWHTPLQESKPLLYTEGGGICCYFWNSDSLVVISKLWLISVMWKHPWSGNSSELQKQILNYIVSSYIRLKSHILLVNLILLNRWKF